MEFISLVRQDFEIIFNEDLHFWKYWKFLSCEIKFIFTNKAMNILCFK
jgi:hypothetical protein